MLPNDSVSVRLSVCLTNQYVCLSGSTSEIVPGFLLLLTTIKIIFLPSWATLACPSVRLSVQQLIWNFYCMFSSDGILFLFLGRIMFSFYFLLLPKWRFLPNILHRVIAVLPYFVVVTVVVISVLAMEWWWCWWPDAGGWLLLILAWPFLHNQNKIKGRTTATDSFVNFAGASQTVGVHLNCYPRSCTTMQSRQDTMCGCKFYWCHGSVLLCISLWFILLFISDFLSLWKNIIIVTWLELIFL